LLLEAAANRIKWRANGLLQLFFEGSVSVRDGRGRLTQTVNLASLVGRPRKGLSHGDDQRFLIVADNPTNAIAQLFDGLEQMLLESLVIGQEQGDDV
jgi:hypothetical protein